MSGPKPGFRIKHVWAFIALDPDDDSEGMPAVLNGDMWMPLVAADEDRLQSLLPKVRAMVRDTGMRIRLVRFDTMTELGDVKSEDGS
jgi:hypothetical protein